jgi:hypothetical protein
MRRTLPGLNADLALAVRRVGAAAETLPEHLRPDFDGSSFDAMEREVDRACGAGDREAAMQAISRWEQRTATVISRIKLERGEADGARHG